MYSNTYKVFQLLFFPPPSFSLKLIDTEGNAVKCAFWEYEPERLQGRWSTRGCRTVHVGSNATTCSCDHLTHFAILMSSGQANVSERTRTRPWGIRSWEKPFSLRGSFPDIHQKYSF